MKKRFFAFLLTVVCLYSAFAVSASAFVDKSKSNEPVIITTVNSVTPVGHEFGDWKRVTTPVTAGQAGELAGYAKVDEVSVTVTSSIGVEIPIEAVALNLGVETTVFEDHKSVTIAPIARALRAGESAACYCRQHWLVYDVDYTLTIITMRTSWFGGVKTQTIKKNYTKRIKVGQDLNATVDENGEYTDCQWFYAISGHGAALTETIKSKMCGEKETYQVYLNRCSA